MDTKGIRITGKDIGFILTIAVMVVGFFVKFGVMETKVESNTKRLDLNPPEVAAESRRNIQADLGEIKTDVKDLVKMINEYILSQ